MTQAPITEMCEVLDAIKIDLKGFTDDFYEMAGAEIIATADEVWSRAEMIMKVKEPIKSEWPKIKEDQVIALVVRQVAVEDPPLGVDVGGPGQHVLENVSDWTPELPVDEVKRDRADLIFARAPTAAAGARVDALELRHVEDPALQQALPLLAETQEAVEAAVEILGGSAAHILSGKTAEEDR